MGGGKALYRSINAKALRKLRHPSRSKRLNAFVENWRKRSARRDARRGEWTCVEGPWGAGKPSIARSTPRHSASCVTHRGRSDSTPSSRTGENGPRDATRGGVNGHALRVHGGRESPLSLDQRQGTPQAASPIAVEATQSLRRELAKTVRATRRAEG